MIMKYLVENLDSMLDHLICNLLGNYVCPPRGKREVRSRDTCPKQGNNRRYYWLQGPDRTESNQPLNSRKTLYLRYRQESAVYHK